MITKKLTLYTAFHTDLQSKLEEGPKICQNFKTFVRVLDAPTPRKTKVLRETLST